MLPVHQMSLAQARAEAARAETKAAQNTGSAV